MGRSFKIPVAIGFELVISDHAISGECQVWESHESLVIGQHWLNLLVRELIEQGLGIFDGNRLENSLRRLASNLVSVAEAPVEVAFWNNQLSIVDEAEDT